jgi:hypothetical protein
MKKLFFVLAALLALLLPAQAAAVPAPAPLTLTVNGQVVQDLPRPLYKADGCVMVPLRKTAEALGYAVCWNYTLHGAQVDDSVQSALVKDGSRTVAWTGELKIIDLTRETELESAAVVLDGHTYVPARFFEELFNTVEVTDSGVTISPNVYTIDQSLPAQAA